MKPTKEETEIREIISKTVEAKLAFIDSNREALLEAWVAQHGWMPDECVLVQQQDGMNVKMWVERHPQEKIDREKYIFTCKWKVRVPLGLEYLESEEEFTSEMKSYDKGSNVAAAAKELGCEAEITFEKRLR